MTFTKERLTELSRRENVGAILGEEIAELARIALASLEAAPVAYMYKDNLHSDARFSLHTRFGNWSQEDINEYEITEIPLYTAPPAPVSVPDEVISAVENLKRTLVNCNRYNYCSDAVKRLEGACRAAMLQGADGTLTNEGTIPANTPCKDAPEHIWLQTAGVWPENGEFSELTWCSGNQHKDDTLYVRADVVTGNSPVIPDGWVACSERMPEDGEKVLTSFRGGMRTAVCKVVDVLGHKIFVDELTLFNGVPADHWQPLPAAPQQEADNE